MATATETNGVKSSGTSHDVNGSVNGFHEDSDRSEKQNGTSSSEGRSYNPPPSSFSMPIRGPSSERAPSGLADFFSQEVFRIVLHNPATAHRLLKFSRSRLCGENMEFLERVDRYNALLDELSSVLSEIHDSYTSSDAPKQLATPLPILNRLNTDIKAFTNNTLPSMEFMFAEAQENVESILRTSVYPRFVKYQMTNSASKALSSDRREYEGLGDCFCLTDPAKADNPIVYASDGFVSVTGYSRQEVVPRNCRFLQGAQTDRIAIKRLKESIDAREETVELLLNYKKNGEPFWNLLYVAPLLDSAGKLAFYIGAQINCSTTIRSNTDVLRILSASDEVEGEKEVLPRTKTSRTNLLSQLARRKSFRRTSKPTDPKVEVRKGGMEQGLLKQIEKLNFRTQMEKFYTAYSKYILIKYSDFVIRNYSRGFAEILSATAETYEYFVGMNVFKLLAQHTFSLPREFKSKIKGAMKQGEPISASIDLLTINTLTQTQTDNRFFTHWTPCKDENGRVEYIVMTLSSTLYA